MMARKKQPKRPKWAKKLDRFDWAHALEVAGVYKKRVPVLADIRESVVTCPHCARIVRNLENVS
jgi:hypothetical protein